LSSPVMHEVAEAYR